MADEMKELRGAVFDLIPDGVSVVALDEIEVDDMAPKRGTSRTRTATSSTALTTSASVVSSTNSPAWLSEIAAASASATR